MAILINELDSDTPGTDAAEFVELYNTGPTSVSLTGYVLVFYNGSNDLSYAAFDLDGYSIAANGYFLLGNAGVPGVSVTFAGNFLQNGADAVALYLGNAADFPNNTPVTATSLVDAVVYDTADPDDTGLLNVLTPGQPQIDEGTTGTNSIQRSPDGSGGPLNTSTFVAAAPTPMGDATAPILTATTPADEATDVNAAADIVLTFDENVRAGAGDIVISNGAGDTRTITLGAPDPDGTVTISGNTVMINPTADLVAGSTYHVTVAAGAIEDAAGNDYAGLAAGGLDFTTTAATSVSIGDASISEGDNGTRVLTFTVTRSNNTGTFSVDYTTANGTATAGSDYVGVTGAPNTVSFTAGGGLTQDVSITINGDLTVEPNETFTVNLGNLVNTVGTATIGDGSATGTILNDDFTRIYAIQGTGHLSALDGQIVTTRGVVTAVDTNGSRGFYIQDPTGDGNSATSDGIFVFVGSSGALPQVGHMVEVTGRVDEFTPSSAATGSFSTTEITSVTSVIDLGVGPAVAPTLIGPGGRLPPTESLIAGGVFYESMEGMLVTVVNPVAIGPTNDFGEIFTVVDNDGNPANGQHATGLTDENNLLLTPGTPDFGDNDSSGGDFNPERIQIDDDNGVLPAFVTPEVNVGAQLSSVTGVVNYDFGNYQVTATQAYTVVSDTREKETSTLAGDADHLVVVSYNAENLDPVIENVNNVANQDPDNVDDDSARFAVIAEEILTVLNAPDIVALQEIQDNDGAELSDVTAADVTLQTLVDEINEQSEALYGPDGPHYAYIDNPFINDDANGGQPGGNIRTAFIYRTDRVDFVEGSLQTVAADGTPISNPNESAPGGNGDQAANPDNPFNNSRPPLAATFVFNGEEITIVNNHFTSKGGSAPLLGTDQPPFAAGEVQRAGQAQAVNNFVDTILAANPDANVIVAGDLNEYQFEEPMRVLRGTATISNYDVPGDDTFDAVADYTPGGTEILADLMDLLPADEQYDYVFDGNSQTLDHLLVTAGLAGRAEFDVVHINAEFADQTSDHDPLVARFAFPLNDPPAIAGDRSIAVNEGGTVVITTADLTENDPDDAGAALTYTVTGTVRGSVLVNGVVATSFTQADLTAGNVGFRHDGSETTSASFTVTLADDEGATSAPATVEATVTPVNDAPVFTSPSAFTTPENQTAVATVAASDAENNPRTFALAGGDDVEFFAINPTSGALRFIDAPDFETPEDHNGDNSYRVVVSVTDSGGAATTQAIAVQVTNVAEPGQTINGTNRSDVLAGGPGPDTIRGKDGNDRISGNDGNDNIQGDDGNDAIWGGNGNDTLKGNDGRDALFGEDGADQLYGGDDDDLLSGGDGNDQLKGEDGKDALFGDDGGDLLFGGDDGDDLSGGDGNDLLKGEDGNDDLAGGDGNDTMTGGRGNDDFIFEAGFGHDVVTDFGRGDRIVFDDHLFSSFSAVRAASRQVGNDTVITLDASNAIVLENVRLSSLSAHDFLFT